MAQDEKRLLNKKSRIHRIGLYIRVSTEEQAENPEGSIKSQEQRLKSHVQFQNQEENFGEIAGVFIDRARSGKDTNRVELQRLFQAIRRKEISLVMVTELSRLSRSIKDVCEFWDLMKENGCEFLSLREKFDTTTAAGEMVLYTIANIAQFERKQCSERIQANFLARAQRGLFNGGSIPFGYELDPDRRGYLRVNEVEAEIVREAYHTFLKEGCLSKAGVSLNHRGFRLGRRRQGGGSKSRLGHFTVDNLHQMLTNPSYRGVRAYRVRGETQTTRACWPAIIEEQVFEQVSKILKRNYRRLKSTQNRRYPFLLSGLVVCGSCGDHLPGKSAHGNGGKIPYYEHGWATKRQAYLNQRLFSCDPHRVLAKKLEPAVWEDILQVLSSPELAQAIIHEAHAFHAKQNQVSEADRIRVKIRDIEVQIEAVAEHLTKIPKGMSPAPIFTQMERLEQIKSEAQREYDAIYKSGLMRDVPVSLKEYSAFLHLIREGIAHTDSQDLRSQIVQHLVHRVEVLPEALRIHYHTGRSRFIATPNKTKEPGVQPPGSGLNHKTHGGLRPFSSPDPLFPVFLFSGSNSLTIGRGGGI